MSSYLPEELVREVAQFLHWKDRAAIRRVSRTFYRAVTHDEEYWRDLRDKMFVKNNRTYTRENHMGRQTFKCHKMDRMMRSHPFYLEIALIHDPDAREQRIIEWQGPCKNWRHYKVTGVSLTSAPRGQYKAFVRDLRQKCTWTRGKAVELTKLQKRLDEMKRKIELLQLCKNLHK